jgi:hypothetical protein
MTDSSLDLWGALGIPKDLKKATRKARKPAKPTAPLPPPSSLRAVKLSARPQGKSAPAAPTPTLAQPSSECIGVDLLMVRTTCACGQTYLAPAAHDNLAARLIPRHTPRTPGEVITGAASPFRAVSMPGHPAAMHKIRSGAAATLRIVNVGCVACPACVAVADELPYSGQLSLPFPSWQTELNAEVAPQ